MSSDLEFRTATQQDLDRVIAIHGSAFPDPRREPERRRNFLANPLGTIDDLWLALDHGEIVGHAFLFRTEAFFGDRPVPTAAIASVGVAPEARGRGVASGLLDHLHREAVTRGAAIALLYAFRHAFYGRHGYAPVSTSARWAFAPESGPDAWLRAFRVADARAPRAGDTAALESLYERAALGKTGWIRRPRALWDAKWLDERNHVVVVGPADAPRGYALFVYDQVEGHARTTIAVEEMVSADAEARRVLFGFLAAQRDQVAEVEMELDVDDPIAFALVDPDRRRHGTARVEHTLGTITTGPMVRILDLDRALRARGYLYDTRSRVRLGDRALSLKAAGGVVAIEEVAAVEVEIDAPFVPSVLFGSLAPSAAAAIDGARGAGSALANADALLGLPRFSAIDRF